MLIIAIAASLVGMLLFRNWGRWLYLVSIALSLPVLVFTGPTIYCVWKSALWDTASMVNGAIMLVMFLPPISNEFNKLSQQGATSGGAA